MAKKPHLIDRVAKQADSELAGMADTLALTVQSELFDDLEEVSDERMVEHVRRSSAADPGYLPKLLSQVGAGEFNRLFDKAFEVGIPRPTPVTPASPAEPAPSAVPPEPTALGPTLQQRAEGALPGGGTM